MAKSTDYGHFTKKHPVTGKEMQRVANSPQDAVRLRFDGWAQQPEPKTTRNAPASTATKPASSTSSS